MLPDHGQIGPIAGSKGLLRPSGEVPQQLGRGSSPRPGNANPHTSETGAQDFTLYNFIKIGSALRGERPRPAQGKPLAGERASITKITYDLFNNTWRFAEENGKENNSKCSY